MYVGVDLPTAGRRLQSSTLNIFVQTSLEYARTRMTNDDRPRPMAAMVIARLLLLGGFWKLDSVPLGGVPAACSSRAATCSGVYGPPLEDMAGLE